MFLNQYEIELNDENGAPLKVALRLTIGGQIKLKKRFNESTLTTLFTAIDDPERLVEVMTEALTWTGNANTIKSGERLCDLLAGNGLLGMIEKQRIITRLAVVSGIVSEKEGKEIDKKTDGILAEKN